MLSDGWKEFVVLNREVRADFFEKVRQAKFRIRWK